jgi:hypothetical protein
MPHAFNADQRCVRCSKTLAASNKYVRSSLSPHYEMRPS